MTNTGYRTKSAAKTFQGTRTKEGEMWDRLMIRRSTDGDATAIRQLAALDSRPAPKGETLLAFVGDELRAALAIDTGEAVADPFHPTAELIELLRVSAHSGDEGSGGQAIRATRPRVLQQAAEVSR